MVEDNQNKTRRGFFGSRRTTRKSTTIPEAPAEPSSTEPVPETTASTHTLQNVTERKPVTDPATEQAPATVPSQPTVQKQDTTVTTTTNTSPPTDDEPGSDLPGAELQATDASTTDAAPEPADPAAPVAAARRPSTSLLFQAPEILPYVPRAGSQKDDRTERGNAGVDRNNGGHDDDDFEETTTVRRRARRRTGDEGRSGPDDPANTVVKVRAPREPELITEPQRIKGSTRLEAKKQRRRDGRDAGRRRPVITEAEFLARRESVARLMVVRAKHNKIQIGVLEDGVLVEHYVAKNQDASLIGNVYLGRVQNVLPSMEAAFVDIGRGRNAVLYSGEVDWDAAAENSGTSNQPRRIELALKPGDKVLVQVTKDPIGHKGARLTSQVSLPGRYLVYVPNGSMNGISRKLPDTERARLKKILKEVLPENVGVIVRTAAEGATDEQLTVDVNRLTAQWASISQLVETAQAPAELHSEPDLLIKIVRDVFNEDFARMVVSGDESRQTIENYLSQVAPDLVERIENYTSETDAFDEHRISEQIEKALDRKVWLPSGGSLVIDRTEAMTVVDVNTGKFVGSGGNLEETVTKNNLEAAEEIVRQLRLRDIGGIIVVDFIDMVLESNRDLVSRRLIECLSRDRTKHQVAEVTSLGLVQMTRKKLGLGLLESFSENCEACAGRGIIVHHDPVTKHRQTAQPPQERRPRARSGNGSGSTPPNGGGHNGASGAGGSKDPSATDAPKTGNGTHGITEDAKNALALIAARTITRTGSIPIVSDAVKAEALAVASAEAADPSAHAAPESNTPESNTPEGNAPEGNATSVADASADQVRAEQPVRTDKPERSEQRSDKPERSESRNRRSRSSRAQSAPTEAPRTETPPAAAEASDAGSESLAILDIPVTKSTSGKRRASKQVTDQMLDSVLESLPEPKQPGQGRARSRRVTTAGGSTAQPIIVAVPDEQN